MEEGREERRDGEREEGIERQRESVYVCERDGEREVS
jgi:hypothetical protein